MSTFPLLPGIYGSSLGFYRAATPTATIGALPLSTIIGTSIPKGTIGALLQAITNDASWRDDGVKPTATVGFALLAGQDPTFLTGVQVHNIELVQGPGGAGVLNVGFYGA